MRLREQGGIRHHAQDLPSANVQDLRGVSARKQWVELPPTVPLASVLKMVLGGPDCDRRERGCMVSRPGDRPHVRAEVRAKRLTRGETLEHDLFLVFCRAPVAFPVLLGRVEAQRKPPPAVHREGDAGEEEVVGGLAGLSLHVDRIASETGVTVRCGVEGRFAGAVVGVDAGHGVGDEVGQRISDFRSKVAAERGPPATLARGPGRDCAVPGVDDLRRAEVDCHLIVNARRRRELGEDGEHRPAPRRHVALKQRLEARALDADPSAGRDRPGVPHLADPHRPVLAQAWPRVAVARAERAGVPVDAIERHHATLVHQRALGDAGGHPGAVRVAVVVKPGQVFAHERGEHAALPVGPDPLEPKVPIADRDTDDGGRCWVGGRREPAKHLVGVFASENEVRLHAIEEDREAGRGAVQAKAGRVAAELQRGRHDEALSNLSTPYGLPGVCLSASDEGRATGARESARRVRGEGHRDAVDEEKVGMVRVLHDAELGDCVRHGRGVLPIQRLRGGEILKAGEGPAGLQPVNDRKLCTACCGVITAPRFKVEDLGRERDAGGHCERSGVVGLGFVLNTDLDLGGGLNVNGECHFNPLFQVG